MEKWVAVLVFAFLGCILTLGVIPGILRWGERRRARVGGTEFHQLQAPRVPRLGGIALALTFVVGAMGAWLWAGEQGWGRGSEWTILLGGLAMFGLGFVDDLRPLGAKRKLAGQILIASGVYFAGLQITTFRVPWSGEYVYFGGWSFPITVFWLVALTNLINLIDGVDGLAGGISLMLMIVLLGVGWGGQDTFTLILVGSMAGGLAGFLRFNLPPARIYLGDSGAYFLGFFIAMMSLNSSRKGTVLAALLAPLFALGVPILDVTLAIFRRGIKGLPIFRADRAHLHHKLLNLGLSRERVLALLYGVSAFCCAVGFGVLWMGGETLPILAGLLIVPLILLTQSAYFGSWGAGALRIVGDSMSSRWRARYAIALMRWFELEGAQTPSRQRLWEDFGFAAEKLSFRSVTLRSPQGELRWESRTRAHGPEESQRRQEFEFGSDTRMEIVGEVGENEGEFEVCAEVAAEGWYKAEKALRARQRF